MHHGHLGHYTKSRQLAGSLKHHRPRRGGAGGKGRAGDRRQRAARGIDGVGGDVPGGGVGREGELGNHRGRRGGGLVSEEAAARRAQRAHIIDTIKNALEGHLRIIIGQMDMETILSKRDEFNKKVSSEAEAELQNMCGNYEAIESICTWKREVVTRRSFNIERLREAKPELHESFIFSRTDEVKRIRLPFQTTGTLENTENPNLKNL